MCFYISLLLDWKLKLKRLFKIFLWGKIRKTKSTRNEEKAAVYVGCAVEGNAVWSSPREPSLYFSVELAGPKSEGGVWSWVEICICKIEIFQFFLILFIYWFYLFLFNAGYHLNQWYWLATSLLWPCMLFIFALSQSPGSPRLEQFSVVELFFTGAAL